MWFLITLLSPPKQNNSFPNTAGVLAARLASGISLSFTKTRAVHVCASLIAMFELGIQ